jgi:peptidyl-prolyl cis-trans isomerase C
VQDIIVLSKNNANNIMSQLKRGSDFTELARENSLRKDVQKTGGISPYVPLSRFGEFRETFENAQLNQLIGPLKINNFYMISRIIGKQDQRPMTYEDVREGIKEVLKQEQKSRSIQAYLENLRSQHNITIDQDRVASVPVLKYN